MAIQHHSTRFLCEYSDCNTDNDADLDDGEKKRGQEERELNAEFNRG